MTGLEPLSVLPSWSRPLASGVGAFLVTAAVTPLVIGLSRRKGWVAEPREDRWHERPTALMGGVAIFVGVAAVLPLFDAFRSYWPVWAGGALLFVSGCVDDLRDVAPVSKLVAQVAAAALLLVGGHELAPALPGWFSVGVTFLWVIGITNAVNLLDNMDGLAAGIAGIAAVTLAVLTGLGETWSEAGPALAVAGASAGFLLYNSHPARIFMGDGGSLFLGYLVAALAVIHPGRGASATTFSGLLVPAAVMAVPILDTTLVTIRRLVSGRPVTQGGRDHSSHRLVFLGLPEGRAVFVLYGVSALFSAVAVVSQFTDTYFTVAVLIFAGVGLVLFGVFLGQISVGEVAGAGSAGSGEGGGTDPGAAGISRIGLARGAPGGDHEGAILRVVLRNKQEMALVVADLLLVLASFVLAHQLRFDFAIPGGQEERMVSALPLVMCVKLLSLWGFDLYRRMLRYTGSGELVRLVKASSVGSLLAVAAVVLVFRFEGFSRSVFVIDWLVATVSLAALRGGFRGLRGYFAARDTRGKRVLLYGAGDAGYLALREIYQNPDLSLQPVGFVDDDPRKKRRYLHGLPVLGTGDDLGDVCDRTGADEVLITISFTGDEDRDRVRGKCRAAGIGFRQMRIGFDDVGPAASEHGETGYDPSAEAR